MSDPTKPKIVHLAALVREGGAVSAKCFRRPKPINLEKATWTLRPEAVTCPMCRRVANGN